MARAARQTGKRVPGFTDEFGERLQQVISRIGTLERASDSSGASVDQLTSWKFGRTRPDFFALDRLCQAAGTPITWLANGDGESDSRPDTSHDADRTQREQAGLPVIHASPSQFVPDGAMVSVPLMNVQASAGFGAVVEQEEIAAYVAFEAAFLRSQGISPAYARLLDVRGDSMYPTLKDGDRVVVDLSIDHVADEGIYAVVLGNHLLIKRIQLRLDGSIVLRSDNRTANYEDTVVEASDLDRLRVIGRIKLRVHRM